MKFTTIFAAMHKAWLPPKVLLVMKLTTLLIIVALVQASAKTYSQVTLNEKDVPVKQVLKSIKKQTGYALIYEANILLNAKVTVNLKDVSINEALETCLKNLPVTYKLVQNNIVLEAKELSPDDKIKAEQNALTTLSRVRQ